MTNSTLTTAPVTAHPRLALVLGSGGVRSAAALGIADVPLWLVSVYLQVLDW